MLKVVTQPGKEFPIELAGCIILGERRNCLDKGWGECTPA